jgi:hypothetical protein
MTKNAPFAGTSAWSASATRKCRGTGRKPVAAVRRRPVPGLQCLYRLGTAAPAFAIGRVLLPKVPEPDQDRRGW